MDYYQKYLKYKTKYLELKKQLGSGKMTCQKCTGIDSMCKSYGGRRTFKDGKCTLCNHDEKFHIDKL